MRSGCSGHSLLLGQQQRGSAGGRYSGGTLEPYAPRGLTGLLGDLVGRYHTCAQAPNSTLFCWGRNDEGQLGDGTLEDRPRPTAVALGMVFVGLDAGGDHTCAQDGVPGAVWCWGDNA